MRKLGITRWVTWLAPMVLITLVPWYFKTAMVSANPYLTQVKIYPHHVWKSRIRREVSTSMSMSFSTAVNPKDLGEIKKSDLVEDVSSGKNQSELNQFHTQVYLPSEPNHYYPGENISPPLYNFNPTGNYNPNFYADQNLHSKAQNSSQSSERNHTQNLHPNHPQNLNHHYPQNSYPTGPHNIYMQNVYPIYSQNLNPNNDPNLNQSDPEKFYPHSLNQNNPHNFDPNYNPNFQQNWDQSYPQNFQQNWRQNYFQHHDYPEIFNQHHLQNSTRKRRRRLKKPSVQIVPKSTSSPVKIPRPPIATEIYYENFNPSQTPTRRRRRKKPKDHYFQSPSSQVSEIEPLIPPAGFGYEAETHKFWPFPSPINNQPETLKTSGSHIEYDSHPPKFTVSRNNPEIDEDLHLSESFNPYLNASVPISTDLRNPYNFEGLHPLFNSDSSLRDVVKIPENKTVGIEHKLNDNPVSVQVAHDLHHEFDRNPFLNHDAIISDYERQLYKNRPRIQVKTSVSMSTSSTVSSSSSSQQERPTMSTTSKPLRKTQIPSDVISSTENTTKSPPAPTTEKTTQFPTPTETATATEKVTRKPVMEKITTNDPVTETTRFPATTERATEKVPVTTTTLREETPTSNIPNIFEILGLTFPTAEPTTTKPTLPAKIMKHPTPNNNPATPFQTTMTATTYKPSLSTMMLIPGLNSNLAPTTTTTKATSSTKPTTASPRETSSTTTTVSTTTTAKATSSTKPTTESPRETSSTTTTVPTATTSPTIKTTTNNRIPFTLRPKTNEALRTTTSQPITTMPTVKTTTPVPTTAQIYHEQINTFFDNIDELSGKNSWIPTSAPAGFPKETEQTRVIDESLPVIRMPSFTRENVPPIDVTTSRPILQVADPTLNDTLLWQQLLGIFNQDLGIFTTDSLPTTTQIPTTTTNAPKTTATTTEAPKTTTTTTEAPKTTTTTTEAPKTTTTEAPKTTTTTTSSRPTTRFFRPRKRPTTTTTTPAPIETTTEKILISQTDTTQSTTTETPKTTPIATRRPLRTRTRLTTTSTTEPPSTSTKTTTTTTTTTAKPTTTTTIPITTTAQSPADLFNLLNLLSPQSNAGAQNPAPPAASNDFLSLLNLFQTTPAASTSAPPQIDILSLLNLFQQQPHQPSQTTPAPASNDFFNLLNLFTQQPTAAPTPKTAPSTPAPSNTVSELQSLLNLLQPSSTPLQPPVPKKVPPTTAPQTPQSELDALVQEALLGSLGLKPNNNQASNVSKKPTTQAAGLSDDDLKSIYALIDDQKGVSSTTEISVQDSASNSLQNLLGILGAQAPGIVTPSRPKSTPAPTSTSTPAPSPKSTPASNLAPTPTSAPTPKTTTLMPVFQNMLKILGIANLPPAIPPTSPPPATDIVPKSPKPKNPDDLILEILTAEANKTLTKTNDPAPIASAPSTTPPPLDLLSQLLAQVQDAQKPNPLRINKEIPQLQQIQSVQNLPQNSQQQLALDLQALLSQNFPNSLQTHTTPQPVPAPSQSIFNLFGNSFGSPKPQKPSGLYYWVDLNAFMGENPTNPEAGLRPKLGAKDYFIKVKREAPVRAKP